MKEFFKKIIIEKQEWLKSLSIFRREINIENQANYVFTGLRRAGKSYFLYQIILDHYATNNFEDVLFINFEDERLMELSTENLQMILEAYYELYDKKPVLFFDEIQNIKHWQKFVRRLADEG